jgi:hypothetical protein
MVLYKIMKPTVTFEWDSEIIRTCTSVYCTASNLSKKQDCYYSMYSLYFFLHIFWFSLLRHARYGSKSNSSHEPSSLPAPPADYIKVSFLYFWCTYHETTSLHRGLPSPPLWPELYNQHIWYFLNFKEHSNRFQGIDFTWFLASIDCSKIPELKVVDEQCWISTKSAQIVQSPSI